MRFTVHVVVVLGSVICDLGLSAPVGGPSAPAYVPDPSGRGTVGLVLSCVFTLSLCVWTAIHVNVFPPGTSWLKSFLIKSGWASMAMFAPEFVLWRSIVQFRLAKSICRDVNSICERYEAPALSGEERNGTQANENSKLGNRRKGCQLKNSWTKFPHDPS